MPNDHPYHHGDLRRTLLVAAIELIGERGSAAISLRDLARRAGVSHAAPAHHFKDKIGLFTAIAIEGNHLLADSLAEALDENPEGSPDLRELGVRYVSFAIGHPAHFELMFRPDLTCPGDPELISAKARAAALLRAGLPPRLSDPAARLAGLAAWSIAHGFATLYLAGNLSPTLGDHDPTDVFRDIATRLPTSARNR